MMPAFHFQLCFNIPKTLDITIKVAEGFLSGDETYQKLVNTLDSQLKRTDLKRFEGFDVYQHMNAVNKTIREIEISVEDASWEIQQRVRANLESSERKKSEDVKSEKTDKIATMRALQENVRKKV